jgi:hypothetical protein
MLAALALALPAAAQTITVTPKNEAVALGKTRQFTATVTGLADPAVSWLVNGMPGGDLMTIGSVSPTGLYTAPGAVPPGGSVQVTARSVSNSNISGSTTVPILFAAPTITSITPQTFPTGPVTLTINGAGFTAGTIGWLDNANIPATYVSPTQVKITANITTAGNHFVRVMNPGSSYTPVYTVVAGNSASYALTISPASAIVAQGATQQFIPTNTTNAVAWTVNGGAGSPTVGTISATGLYTAPAAVASPFNVTIGGTSTGMSAAAATLTIVPNTPPGITSINPTSVPTGIFKITINGSNFVNGTTATLGGTPLAVQYSSPTVLVASGFTTANGPMNLVVGHAGLSSQPYPVQVGVPNPKVTVQTARRFLGQAAFGPDSAMTAEVQQRGIDGWIDWQVTLAGSNYQGLGTQGGMPSRFLTNAVMNQDQLRQRIAWAYSQIFVTSLNKLIFNSNMVPYQEMLLSNAFVNFRKLLNDVTLSPGMGWYLDMANNGKGNTAGTILPNENYAREVLQLFSIGTAKLGYGGVPLTGPGSAAYDQAAVSAFARAFTGWGYAGKYFGAYINPDAPMVAHPTQHDTGAKALLNRTLIAGQSPELDLEHALDDIFQHPNTGYFIGKVLIQKLVKANPTPAYVEAVAQAFNNTAGVRGDMVAVIRAILKHPEARQNDTGVDLPDDGQLLDPALFLTGMLRSFNATVNDQHYFTNDLRQMSQDIFSSPSVFNYYPPGGEIQLYTPATSIYRANLVMQLMNQYNATVVNWGPGTTFDLAPFVGLANSPATLVDAIDLTLTHGHMPGPMKSILTTAVQNETGGALRKVQTALTLVLNSGYYNVMR